ncbi:hypothetical protein FHG66_13105 [Rubellimicrobium rubrum]|uniref:Uncharacterized protein n=1 Tax=Rubellimicrobium rubrum TaxID=2585369 RepID=A0A5C4MXR9_9RHOB|nr:hypothetical protein [Rubellimicrobium rubrum]TNC48747.1 hypothetical protein FHG66_13105 [Rubellimicrobium rubrum]
MTRHIADHPAPEDATLRLRHFLRIEREEQRHPAVQALHVRRPASAAETRLGPILKVLREHDH